jgi:uncharacterized protein YbjQ (UPF0145 family)
VFAALFQVLTDSLTTAQLAMLAVVLSAGNVGVWAVLRRSSPIQALHWLGVAVTLVAIAIWIQFGGPWAVATWATEGAVVFWIATRARREWLRVGAWVLLGLAIYRWLQPDIQTTTTSYAVVANARALTGIYLVGLLYVAAWLQRREPDAAEERRRQERAALLIAASIITLFVISTEIMSFWADPHRGARRDCRARDDVICGVGHLRGVARGDRDAGSVRADSLLRDRAVRRVPREGLPRRSPNTRRYLSNCRLPGRRPDAADRLVPVPAGEHDCSPKAVGVIRNPSALDSGGMAAINPALVTTGFDLPGHRTVRNLGVVRGIVVRSRSIVGTIGASLQTLVGGNITLYTELCERAREDAFHLMLAHAAEMGANALIGVRYDANEVAAGVTEVLAYGTAVVVEAT